MTQLLRGLGIVGIVGIVIGGMSTWAQAADGRQLGETATRLPRGRLATSVEGGHSCLVIADGSVKCWGVNALGQLGDGTTSTPATAVRVSGISTAVAVATGRDHTCALLVDATVRCWGANAVGQLGNGSTTASLTPVTVTGLTNVVSISAGSLHTCGRLGDGTVACWGSNEFGRLGDNTEVNRPLPVQAQGLTNARMVAAGVNHTCAVRADGTVACWGGGGGGQLGLGDANIRRVPTPVPAALGVWLVATGNRYTCVVRGNGLQQCWGTNQLGQFGDGTITSSLVPVPAGGPSPSKGLALGSGHTCIVVVARVRCWGQNTAGQLGTGVAGSPLLTPGATVANLEEIAEVAAGLDRTCALAGDDTVLCWGENSAAQLGNGSLADALTPTLVGGLGGAVSARGVAAGLLHTCAWRADGTVACWGRNAAGALGDGTFTERHVPTPVPGPDHTSAVFAGDHHTCAAAVSGTVLCWGRNVEGQVNPRNAADFIVTAESPQFNLRDGFAAGARHSISMVVSAFDGTLGWGGNEALQLGDTFSGFDGFFRASVTEPIAVVTGAQHSCALQARGTVRCWGSNQFGQLGTNDPSTTAVSAPQQVQGIVDAVTIGAGQFHTCAVLVAGGVRCWGRNDFGQLGDGTTVDRRAPTAVGVPIGTAVGVVAGRTYSCLLRVTGGVQCWGANSRGELGDTTTIDRAAPVFVQQALGFFLGQSLVGRTVTLNQVVALVGGNTHVCAVRVSGEPVCWGNNANGQLGDGTTSDRPVAVSVPSFLANIAADAEVDRRGRHAEVTALVNCPEGADFRVHIRLSQEPAEGQGHAAGTCEGALAPVVVDVNAQGRAGFQAGPAEASAVIDVRRHGSVVSHQEWTRAVDLHVSP